MILQKNTVFIPVYCSTIEWEAFINIKRQRLWKDDLVIYGKQDKL